MKQIRTLENLDATVRIPGSKSITHRYLIMAALAEGRSQLRNTLWCDDTRYTAKALESLGAQIIHSPEAAEVTGTGGKLDHASKPIFLDNAGTSMRLLTAVACLAQGDCVLTGSDRMHRRPIGELLAGLRPLGGVVESVQKDGCPPVHIHGKGLKGGRTLVDASRSVSRPYVDVTLDGMSRFGAVAGWLDEATLRVEAPGHYRPGNYDVEGDCSSASYFWAAAAITGGKITTLNIVHNSRQGDLAFLELLSQMGCRVEWHDHGVTVLGGRLRGIEVDMRDMPDMVPTLAVTAAFAEGTTAIRNVGHLRIKESDRLQAVAEGLQRLGVQVNEGRDSLTIMGGSPVGALIDPHDDHRIAMSFAIAGLVTRGVRIADETCVDKSFPEFWDRFEELYESRE
jgi:3-phosphoshikimate 1-carboxyvinyltransferase